MSCRLHRMLYGVLTLPGAARALGEMQQGSNVSLTGMTCENGKMLVNVLQLVEIVGEMKREDRDRNARWFLVWVHGQ